MPHEQRSHIKTCWDYRANGPVPAARAKLEPEGCDRSVLRLHHAVASCTSCTLHANCCSICSDGGSGGGALNYLQAVMAMSASALLCTAPTATASYKLLRCCLLILRLVQRGTDSRYTDIYWELAAHSTHCQPQTARHREPLALAYCAAAWTATERLLSKWVAAPEQGG